MSAAASLKRKTPPTYSQPPGMGSRQASAVGAGSSRPGGVGVKREPSETAGGGGGGAGDWKRSKLGLVSNVITVDPRSAAMDLEEELKGKGTMPLRDAYFYLQENVPELNAQEVIEFLKGLPRVGFNKANEVLSYVPALTITSQNQLLTHIRLHTAPRQALNMRDPAIKDATKDQPLIEWLVNLEQAGEILISRGIGPFSQSELPKLGRLNGLGQGISDLEKGTRVRAVFWDEVRNRGRAGKRVDEEDLSASSTVPEPPKPVPGGPAGKKKKKSNRVLKITNTHMKALGVDFSKDYDAGNK